MVNFVQYYQYHTETMVTVVKLWFNMLLLWFTRNTQSKTMVKLGVSLVLLQTPAKTSLNWFDWS